MLLYIFPRFLYANFWRFISLPSLHVPLHSEEDIDKPTSPSKEGLQETEGKPTLATVSKIYSKSVSVENVLDLSDSEVQV